MQKNNTIRIYRSHAIEPVIPSDMQKILQSHAILVLISSINYNYNYTQECNSNMCNNAWEKQWKWTPI